MTYQHPLRLRVFGSGAPAFFGRGILNSSLSKGSLIGMNYGWYLTLAERLQGVVHAACLACNLK